MTLKPPHETFVHTTTELTELWRDMMGPGGFSCRSLWMIFIADDGEMAPVVAPCDDLPLEPDEPFLHGFKQIISELTADSELSAAFLLSRPGPSQLRAEDRRWAAALIETLGPQLSPWPIHLATAGRVRVIAPDDLIPA